MNFLCFICEFIHCNIHKKRERQKISNAYISRIASPAPVPKKRDELTFDDDEDDLMDALGFGESPKESPKKNETVLIPKNER